MNAVRQIAAAICCLALAVTTASPAFAGKRSTIKIINNSSSSVLSIYSSPKYRNTYGSVDLLGRNTVLRSGYYIYVDFDSTDAEDECVQDVMAKSSNGSKWTHTMNICTTTSWTLTD
jgi:malate/lactate dehydrogenase